LGLLLMGPGRLLLWLGNLLLLLLALWCACQCSS
jgi:hypothetical protein